MSIDAKPSRRAQKQRAFVEVLITRIQPRFYEIVGEWPEDPNTRKRLLRLFVRHGPDVAWRALEKASDLDEPETTDDVVNAAFGLIEAWASKGWLK